MPDTHTPSASTDTPASYKAALEIPIPIPRLTHSFRLVCDLEAVRSVGEGLHGDGGQFNWINFTGGHFEGSWGHGEIVAGGQDAQHIMPSSHPSSPLAAQLSTRYLLRTSDGIFIQVQTRGWRTGPPHILQALSSAAREGYEGEVPGPEEYKFRLCVEMETDSRNERYAWLNTSMWVGSGVRSGRQVIYDAYLIE
ncbi:hypothetical protein NBRC10512_005472 [Rhodotorula toruloides]|uniref:RHTO0S22e01024g1_1 n=2 Tax=Rhodotorula toruloides TaxID=5286 RepID=A0A061BGB8_RHOTO|nr:outer membrane protein, beta-barrel domain containing protein [Rhodotorula toruloides NP11]EMS18905.1 outer membrane protein, beta-barrel domain containing protein [Rhodotorula toruloides NP11]CDR49002.1 RHTO0S22e01024g1_1 [Rhodotorula toruloides]